ncbi:MAG: hypothetical protein M3Y40_01420 [Chloroflexota bacterium]|nr:hypothetical protein [Chloroflexota bacterium]
MTREARLWTGAVVVLAAFVALMLVFGNLGAPRPEVDPLTVDEVLSDGSPADRFGDDELHVIGWYAELDADCVGDDGGASAAVAWLQRECPLRVLLPAQPSTAVTQEQLLADGVLLAAPLGNAFPSRAEPGGPNLRGGQLVFVGRFAHPAAADCVPERLERCRNTLVVTDYDEQIR